MQMTNCRVFNVIIAHGDNVTCVGIKAVVSLNGCWSHRLCGSLGK